MLNILKNLFSSDEEPAVEVDVSGVIEQIKQKEQAKNIPLGRRIHTLEYGELYLFLDRDITENYRVTAYRGRERIYSFSIFAGQGNYEVLEKGYQKIMDYLASERKVSDLPEDENIKGHFYGY